MSASTPYVAAGVAIGATFLLERISEAPSTSSLPATRVPGFDSTLNLAAARALPCGTTRLSSVTTLTGAEIRRLPSGAGEDFVREFLIQRSSLTRALGDIGIPGLTNRPKLSARCAVEWCALWLDAFQSANGANPRAFALESHLITGTNQIDPIGDWRSFQFGRSAANVFGGPLKTTSLGRAFEELRALHAHAAIETAGPLADVRPWIRARNVTEGIQDFARELDSVAFTHDVGSEALAALRHDLHPIRVVEKAADLIVKPVELALDKVIGPSLAALVGTLLVSLAPLLVVGGVVYVVAKRGGIV